MNLISTPLLPEGYQVPASRNEPASKRLRRLLAEKPYVFAPGVYDPMGAELVVWMIRASTRADGIRPQGPVQGLDTYYGERVVIVS